MTIEDPQRPQNRSSVSPPPRRRRPRAAGDPRAADRRDQLAWRRASHAITPRHDPSLAPCDRAGLTPAEQRSARAPRRPKNRRSTRVLAYTPAVTSGGSKGDELALTFDDGPGPYTQQLVERAQPVLHVHATFFAIGEEERYFSAGTLARAALRRRRRRPHRDAPDDGLALRARTARRAVRTDRPHRTARRAAAAPVPAALRLVQRDHLQPAAPAAPADGAVVDRHLRLHAAGSPARSCRARSRAPTPARSS